MAYPENRSRLSRRSVLKLGGLMGTLPIGKSLDKVVAPPPPNPLRSPERWLSSRLVEPLPLPPLEVIALNHLTFGPRPGDLESFRNLGATDEQRLIAFADQQLNPASILDSACDARLINENFQTMQKSLEQLWADHVVNNDQGWEYRMLPLTESERAAWIRAVYSKRQLFEILADFWHNHFNVYGWHSYVGPVFVHYDRDVIRANALGNFRQMLEDVAKSTAMLYYLDNYINQVGGFNENWARELLELHSLGAENYLGVMDPFSVPVDENGLPVGYVDNDVYEAARCFTGWRLDYSSWEPGVGQSGTFLYYPDWHDRANKFFMQKYLPADQAPLKDGLDVLDAIAAHPGTARHIARKLARRLISDNPPEEVVAAAAAVFISHVDSPDQLKRVVREIILSDAFRTTFGDKIKRPFECAASILRITNADFIPSNEFSWNSDDMGQPLFSYGAPNGYSDEKEDWTGTTSLLQRWQLTNALLEGWIEGSVIDLVSQMPSSVRTPNAIADFWINRILGRPMHPAENRQEIVEFIAQGRNPDFDLPDDMRIERTPRMVALILMSPDFQYR